MALLNMFMRVMVSAHRAVWTVRPDIEESCKIFFLGKKKRMFCLSGEA